MQPRFLVTGALGQIGSELSVALRTLYRSQNVITSDVRRHPTADADGPFIYLDVCNITQLHEAVVTHNVNCIVHLSAIMSVKGEMFPELAMDININGARNVLDVCRAHSLRCFIPSSMAVFGPDAGKTMTKEDTIINPITIYGVTKHFMEQLGSYYHRKFGLDFRSLRYPGLISAEVLPGGGTTDYAIHMFHAALRGKSYECPLLENEPLPMMDLTDAVKGTVKFLEAPRSELSRCTYNVAAFSFTPKELAEEIHRQGHKLNLSYKVGPSQAIAHSWPDTMDDSLAKKDWGWDPSVTFPKMVEKMLKDIPKFHDISKS